jgi:hypothetical protein
LCSSGNNSITELHNILPSCTTKNTPARVNNTTAPHYKLRHDTKVLQLRGRLLRHVKKQVMHKLLYTNHNTNILMHKFLRSNYNINTLMRRLLHINRSINTLMHKKKCSGAPKNGAFTKFQSTVITITDHL